MWYNTIELLSDCSRQIKRSALNDHSLERFERALYVVYYTMHVHTLLPRSNLAEFFKRDHSIVVLVGE